MSENQQDKKQKRKKILYTLAACGIAATSFLSGFFIDRLTWDQELRELARIKERMQKSYYEEITDEEFYDVVFAAVNDQLLDDYSWYMTPSEYAQSQEEAKGQQSGLGLVFNTKTSDGQDQMLVSRVCGNSPAEAAGIMAGDKVVGFGDSETQITDSVVFDEFSDYILDKNTGEKFYVKLQKVNGGTAIVQVSRENYVENYVFYRTNTESYSFTGEKASELTQGSNALSALANDTAYIRLTAFNGSAALEFQSAMNLFKRQEKTNLVLDLRGNGGGFLHIMQDIAGYFCKNATERKPVVAIADYGEKTTPFKAYGNYYYDYFKTESRICVLADNGSASASECLLGSMLDHGAIAYGDICLSERGGVAKTYGKGIMQTTYPFLTSGGAVKLTTAKILWPKGNCIHGVGILPANGTKTVAENYAGDSEIEAALSALFS